MTVNPAFLYVNLTLLTAFSLIEFMRLRLGTAGNLGERVPELVGCLLMTCTIQWTTCIYFLGIQHLFNATLPLEYALNGLQLGLFLIPESWYIYHLVKTLIRAQAVAFFLSMDDEEVEDGVAPDWRARELEKMQKQQVSQYPPHPNAVTAPMQGRPMQTSVLQEEAAYMMSVLSPSAANGGGMQSPRRT
jgi:hypothetical protein